MTPKGLPREGESVECRQKAVSIVVAAEGTRGMPEMNRTSERGQVRSSRITLLILCMQYLVIDVMHHDRKT